MKGLDRYLVLPEQLALLRSDGRGSGVLPEVGVFLGFFLLGALGETAVQFLWGILLGLVAAVQGVTNPADLLTTLPDWTLTAVSLFSTLGMTGVVLLLLRFGQKRKLATAGLCRPFWKEYGLGLLVGFGIFALAVAVAWAAGGLRFTGLSGDFAVGPFLLLFAGFVAQGFSEELLCRGCFMMSVARKNSVTAGVLLNAGVFAALHLFNAGIGLLPIVNLFLFGVFASLYYLWRGNLWGIAAVHSMWNFAQGNIFGILVSGGDFGMSLLTTEMTGSPLINGGDFGMEGGLAVTLVLLLGIALVEWRNIDRIAKTPMPLMETERL